MKRFWRTKLSIARRLWRNLRPDEKLGGKWASRGDFWFESKKSLSPQVSFGSHVSGWQVDNQTWSLRTRGVVYDSRVSDINSFAVGRDTTDLYVLDFDVLAAFGLIHRECSPVPPVLELDAPDSDVENGLERYCRMVDAIWAYLGGYDLCNLPQLAIWIIHNRKEVGAPLGDVPMICAAFIYGDVDLSRGLLADYELHWEARLRLEPNRELVRKMQSRLAKEIGRLRQIIGP